MLDYNFYILKLVLYFNKLLSKYLTLFQTSFCTSKIKIFDSVQAHKDSSSM